VRADAIEAMHQKTADQVGIVDDRMTAMSKFIGVGAK
jgi:hypothetical protein